MWNTRVWPDVEELSKDNCSSKTCGSAQAVSWDDSSSGDLRQSGICCLQAFIQAIMHVEESWSKAVKAKLLPKLCFFNGCVWLFIYPDRLAVAWGGLRPSTVKLLQSGTTKTHSLHWSLKTLADFHPDTSCRCSWFERINSWNENNTGQREIIFLIQKLYSRLIFFVLTSGLKILHSFGIWWPDEAGLGSGLPPCCTRWSVFKCWELRRVVAADAGPNPDVKSTLINKTIQ